MDESEPDPLTVSHGLVPSQTATRINLFIPVRALYEKDGDFPVRCSHGDTVRDTASWVKIASFDVPVPPS